MDTANLLAFVTVAMNRSFSIAAKKLHLTQPAISKRILSLELQLNTALFDRINRKISLTEAGRTLLPRAQKILNDIDDCKRTVTNLSCEVSGTLSLGTSHHIGLYRLPPILIQYNSQYSSVDLDLHFMDSETACSAVERGDLEMAIVTLPLTAIKDIHTKVIWSDPLSVIVNNKHALAKFNNISLLKLAKFKTVLPATGTYTREIIDQVMLKHNIQLKISLTTNYLETIKMLVSVGLGWSILPTSMLSNDIKILKVRELQLSRQLGIVWHANRTLSNAANSMINLLIN